MRSFAEEKKMGTMELLLTKPLSEWDIIIGKFLAGFALVLVAVLPTLIYYYSIYLLGEPTGNIDTPGVIGSYIGLILLGGGFTAIGVFSSALTNNQIVAFILAVFFCFLFHWGFFFFSKLPVFVGKFDDVVQMLGIDYHYLSISKGVVDSRDVIYFFSVILAFLGLTVTVLEKRKW